MTAANSVILSIFRRFDANGDGSISRNELAAVLRGLDERWTPELADQLFYAIDTNNDGSVDYQEILNYCYRESKKEETQTGTDLRLFSASEYDAAGHQMAASFRCACAAAKVGNMGAILRLVEVSPAILHLGLATTGETLVHVCAKLGLTDVVLELLDARADARAMDKNGNTPAKLAAENGHNDLARILSKGLATFKLDLPAAKSTARGSKASSGQRGSIRA